MNRKTMWRLCLLAGLALIALGAATDASAQVRTVIGETSVVVPAGGEAIIPFNAFCLEFGEPFPDAVSAPGELATDAVRKILKTAIAQELAEAETLQTQLAIWHTIESEWGYDEADVDLSVAKSLVDDAADATTAPLVGLGTALDEAIAAGTVEVAVTEWATADAEKVFASDAPYYGAGELTVTNVTDADVTIYYPVGLVLPAFAMWQLALGGLAALCAGLAGRRR